MCRCHYYYLRAIMRQDIDADASLSAIITRRDSLRFRCRQDEAKDIIGYLFALMRYALYATRQRC